MPASPLLRFLCTSAILAVLGVGVFFTQSAEAQEAPFPRPPMRFEGEWFYLAGAIFLPPAGPWKLGGEGGFGMSDYFDTSGRDFTKFTHLGLVLTRTLSSRSDAELAAHGGLGQYRPPECTGLRGCWGRDPTWFGGLMAGVDFGGEYLRAGMRLGVLRFQGRTMAAWTPFIIRLRF